VVILVLSGCGAGEPKVVETVKFETDARTEIVTTTETIEPERECAEFRKLGEEMAAAGSELSGLVGEIGLLQSDVHIRTAMGGDPSELDRQLTDLQRRLAASWERVAAASSAVKAPTPEAVCE
jgi:transposase